MAFSTANQFRAIQFLADGHLSLPLPDASKSGSASGFDSLAEFSVAAGVYPILVTAAGPAAVIKGILIMLSGGFVGGYPALIVPEEPIEL
jgi:hypothetical protein